MEGINIEELKVALSQLPEELQKELEGKPQEIDSVAIKFELIKFVTDLHKHNQGVNWETNKVKPRTIELDDVIEGSQRLFDFLIE